MRKSKWKETTSTNVLDQVLLKLLFFKKKTVIYENLRWGGDHKPISIQLEKRCHLDKSA